MFYRIVLLITCIGVFHNCLSNEKHVQTWCSKAYHEACSDEERCLILNALYWSWQRSEQTLHVQNLLSTYLQHAQKLFTQSMSARLNPARLSSLTDFSEDTWLQDLKNFEQMGVALSHALAEYQKVCATYAHCLEYCVKGSEVRSGLQECVKELREQARRVMADGLKKEFFTLNKALSHIQSLMDALPSQQKQFHVNRGIINYLVDLAVPGLFTSFAKFDAQYTACNDRVWKTLCTSYNVGNIVWHIAETVRARFYHERYVMYNDLCAKNRNYSALVCTAFDEHGFVEPQKREEPSRSEYARLAHQR